MQYIQKMFLKSQKTLIKDVQKKCSKKLSSRQSSNKGQLISNVFLMSSMMAVIMSIEGDNTNVL